MVFTGTTNDSVSRFGPSSCRSQRVNGLSAVPDTATLYDLHRELAYSLALRIVRDSTIAEEVVQDAFLAVWRNADTYDPGRGSLRGWICRIVRNRAIDRLRSRQRRDRDCSHLDDVLGLCSPLDVVAEVIGRDDRRRVGEAVAALPPAQRATVELAYFSGYSQVEIARITKMPLGTVKSRTRLAMRALAESLATVGASRANLDTEADANPRQPGLATC